MRLRTAPLLCLLAALSLPAARADEASRVAKARQMFELAHIDQLTTQMMNQVFEQLRGGMMQQIAGVQMNSQQQKVMDEFAARLQTLLTDSVGWKVLEPDFAKLYADTYTDEELDGILAFYRSPAGQAMVAKTPTLAAASAAISQKRVQSIAPRIRQLALQYQSEIERAARTPGSESPAASPAH
jgi:hypothetical protein